MYGPIVRNRVEAVFDHLSRGEWAFVVDGLAPDVRHVFPGEHPLGGVRHSREAVRRWFERLGRLFPGHEFEVHQILSGGWPWDIRIAVQWTATLRPRAGEPYANSGAHWIRVRWGRVTSFHAYLDTQRIADACGHMADVGIEEAAEPPILD